MQILLFVLAVVLFVGLILIHEWGHFIVARRNGVEAEEFGLGLPPRAVGKRLKSGMVLSLNWLPLGGFVKLRGEHDGETSPGSFGAASIWAKTKILLAGVTMNLIAGLALLTILALIGMPKLLTADTVGQDQFTVKSDTKVISQQVLAGTILPDSPAQRIGLTNTDIILSVKANGQNKEVKTRQQLHDATKSFAGQNVELTYKHNGQTVTKEVRLLSSQEVLASRDSDNPKGYLGVAPNELVVQRSTWSAPLVALGLAKQFFELTIQGLGHALSGLGSAIAGLVTQNQEARQAGQTQASSQVGGPVAIVAILWNSGTLGINFELIFIAYISLVLALMNILPIPALDGGRLLLMLISRGIFKKPLSRGAEEKIVGTAMALLLALIVLITIVDVKRFL